MMGYRAIYGCRGMGLALLACLALASCRYTRCSYELDHCRVTEQYYSWPRWSTSYTRQGLCTVSDTAEGFRVYKIRFRYEEGCFHHRVVYEKRIQYTPGQERVYRQVNRRGRVTIKMYEPKVKRKQE